MDGDPRDLANPLARIIRAHLQPERVHALDDRLRTPDRPRRPIETRKEPIAGGVDLTPPEPKELRPYQLVVTLQELVPGTMSHNSLLGTQPHKQGSTRRTESPRLWRRCQRD